MQTPTLTCFGPEPIEHVEKFGRHRSRQLEQFGRSGVTLMALVKAIELDPDFTPAKRLLEGLER